MDRESHEQENALAYAALRENFLAYCHYIYQGFKAPRHVRMIAEALQMVERGEVRRLLISIPPRHFKSTLVCHLFASWYLGRHPGHRVIAASYGADLAEKHSKECRRLVEGERFRRVFPSLALAPDARGITEWDLEGFGGGYKAGSVGGPITGHGANLLILDDVHKNREEANSENLRQRVWDWYTSDAFSRLQPSPAEAAVIVIHTRWHEDDLIGRLLRAQDAGGETWHEVRLPAIDDQGRALFWGLEVYDTIRQNTSAIDWASVWQGDPLQSAGDQFQADWFVVEDRAPEIESWVRYWDLAIGTKMTNDFTAGALVGLDAGGTLWVRDVRRVKGKAPDVRKLIIEQARLDPEGTSIGLPRDLIGTPIYDDLIRDPAMLRTPIMPPYREQGDKLRRAAVWQTRAANDRLRLVKGAWNEEFIRECLAFPNGKHDDQVDAVSGATHMLHYTRGGARAGEPMPEEGTYEYYERIIDEGKRVREAVEAYEARWDSLAA